MKKAVKSHPKKLIFSKKPVYDTDFFAWTQTQAELLKKKDFSHLDLKNLIEEIETLGKSDKRALYSYLVCLLMHMLKIEFQKDKKTNSWMKNVSNSKLQIRLILKDSPSLNNYLQEVFVECYKDAVKEAVIETGLDKKNFPKECLWKIEEIL